jgi:hypothetical protein
MPRSPESSDTLKESATTLPVLPAVTEFGTRLVLCQRSGPSVAGIMVYVTLGPGPNESGSFSMLLVTNALPN